MELELSTPVEGDPLFAPELQQLQTLYPRAYARGYTSTVGHLGPEYDLDRAGTALYLFPFGGEPYPIKAHDSRAYDVSSKAEGHTDLFPIIYDQYPGQAQERREGS